MNEITKIETLTIGLAVPADLDAADSLVEVAQRAFPGCKVNVATGPYRRCPCGSLMAVGGRRHRGTRNVLTYCSTACRMKSYRKRKAGVA